MFCTYFGCDVDLTEEREEHIRRRHPDLFPKYRHLIAEVLLNTEEIYRDIRPNSFIFTRWIPELLGGKFLAVVVIRERPRTWVVTAHVARRITTGHLIWKLKA
jgi:hypothetical protein